MLFHLLWQLLVSYSLPAQAKVSVVIWLARLSLFVLRSRLGLPEYLGLPPQFERL